MPLGKDEIDVFISYSSKDLSWADQLYQELNAKGFNVFLDIHELQAGANWKAQLTAEMQKARYFVGFWSQHASQSKWVDHEAVLFQSKLPPAGPGLIRVNERLIFILLDDENVPYGELQMIRYLKDAGVYAGGVNHVLQKNPALWQRVVGEINRAVTSDETTVAVPLLILTTTSSQLNDIDSTQPPPHLPFAESLDDLLKRIGLAKDDLIKRYGLERTDWKPFGSSFDIITLLNQDRDIINNLPGSSKIRWEPIGPKFWSGTQQEMLTEIDKLLRPKLAVIVIDPLAFYDVQISARFAYLLKCLDNEHAVVIVLAPFMIPDSTRAFREALQKIALDIYRDYYEPCVHRMPSARCSVSFGDDLDIRRSLLATLRNYFHQTEAKPAHPYTQVGGGARP
jgi:hypothetical protein